MVTHVVIFTWIADATKEQITEFRTQLAQLALNMREFGTFKHGPDLQFRTGNGDYALVASFPDRTTWDSYQAHPNHTSFLRDFVTPILATRTTIQF